MKYYILTGYDDCELSNKVDDWIAEGWKPFGGVAVIVIPKGMAMPDGVGTTKECYLQYSQAFIHESEDPRYPGMD